MKKLLNLLIFLTLTIAVKAQLSNGVMAYWKFDETSGNAVDASGNNNSCSITGANSYQTGKLGRCYSFDGDNDYLEAANSTSLNISGSVSISAWIQINDNTYNLWILGKPASSSSHVSPYKSYGIHVDYDNGTMTPGIVVTTNGAYNGVNTNANISTNQWYHIVGVYDGSYMKIYQNGTFINQLSWTGNLTTFSTPLRIGVNGGYEEDFSGLIDEVGIWNRALTDSEVSSLYNLGAGLSYPFGTTTALIVTTTAASSIAQTTATIGGNVTADGGASVTARGVCWSTTANPTIALTTKTSDGSGTGTFTSSITGLTANTTYHVRAYATNSAGTSYGSDISFTTTSSGPTSWQTSGSNIYYNSGKVSIGTNIANSASALTVGGKILATEVEVVSGISADYVFEPEYQLMPLTELELYLRQNKHLPGIPSAQQFAKSGQNLAKTDDLLLRKIEELTLYIIELKKENEKLKELNSQVQKLRAEVDQLKNK